MHNLNQDSWCPAKIQTKYFANTIWPHHFLTQIAVCEQLLQGGELELRSRRKQKML
jgi:hypothetical protein